ncbi:Adherens junction-associated protein 1, partial [Eschrichtius robustus]|nr:Adherens junction-associated protein 1 [Eschrichtius robustus]
MFIRWPGCSLGSHAWILIAMFQLALDLPACESLGPGPEFRLLPRLPHRPPRVWSFKSGQPARVPAPVWSPRPPRLERGHSHGQMLSPRARRAHRPRDQVAALGPKAGLAKPPAAAKSSPSLGSSSSSSSSAGGSGAPTDQQALLRRGKRHLQGPAFNSFDFRGSRPTTETEFIAWGPTGEEEAPESNTFPGVYGPTKVSIFQTRKTAVATATATATATTATSVTLQTQGVTEPLDPRSGKPVGVSTTEPSTSPSRDSGKVSKPPRVLGETS